MGLTPTREGKPCMEPAKRVAINEDWNQNNLSVAIFATANRRS